MFYISGFLGGLWVLRVAALPGRCARAWRRGTPGWGMDQSGALSSGISQQYSGTVIPGNRNRWDGVSLQFVCFTLFSSLVAWCLDSLLSCTLLRIYCIVLQFCFFVQWSWVCVHVVPWSWRHDIYYILILYFSNWLCYFRFLAMAGQPSKNVFLS